MCICAPCALPGTEWRRPEVGVGSPVWSYRVVSCLSRALGTELGSSVLLLLHACASVYVYTHAHVYY